MSHSNQHKPLPPEKDLEPVVHYYWSLGLPDTVILRHVWDHLDSAVYGLSLKSLKRLRKKWGLLSTRQQQHSSDSISPFVAEIRSRFPTMGARQMVSVLRQDYGIKIPEKTLLDWLNVVEHDAVQQRLKRRFKRKRFWAAGVMDILAFDQHDKWKHFGLWLHMGLDPFSGRLAWLKIWWTNRNPRLITSYYLEAGRAVGGVPLITQSDPGSENYGIANCHTLIRHRLDPSLADTIQHRWKRDKMNIKPEAGWSQLRRQFTPGFENILDSGFNSGLYNADDPVERLIFRWLAIPWLQAELDAWMRRFNSTPRRADKNKVLPCGIPDLISTKPHLYGTRDFMVIVPPELFDEMEREWANPQDPVFSLIPAAFETCAIPIYNDLGQPAVTSATFWDIYIAMLAAFRNLPDNPLLDESLRDVQAEVEEIELLSGLQDLPHGDGDVDEHGYCYMGGLANPPTAADGNIDVREYAYFTSSEDDSS